MIAQLRGDGPPSALHRLWLSVPFSTVFAFVVAAAAGSHLAETGTFGCVLWILGFPFELR